MRLKQGNGAIGPSTMRKSWPKVIWAAGISSA
jgi:hypothetical protein